MITEVILSNDNDTYLAFGRGLFYSLRIHCVGSAIVMLVFYLFLSFCLFIVVLFKWYDNCKHLYVTCLG